MAFARQTTMVNPGPPWLPRLVAEDLGTCAILVNLSTTLTGRFRTMRKDGMTLTPDKRSGQGIHSLLVQIASGTDHIPDLYWVYLIGFEQDRTVHLLQCTFSIPVDLYSTRRRLFACRVELPTKDLPSVVDSPHKPFAVRCSIHDVPRVHPINHLGGISLTNWQIMSCER